MSDADGSEVPPKAIADSDPRKMCDAYRLVLVSLLLSRSSYLPARNLTALSRAHRDDGAPRLSDLEGYIYMAGGPWSRTLPNQHASVAAI